EWEYAARGGVGARFPTGPVLQLEDANFDDPGGGADRVGRYAANGFGLSDMAGNLWEWVADCGAFYSASGAGSGPVTATPCLRVLRGGGFRSTAHELRSANRYFHRSDTARDDFGLRVAADVQR
ncbi:MAG: SUMF1/EgtB/PvdO family nonheme iron enzyme, partial [Myxococcota bacterium]